MTQYPEIALENLGEVLGSRLTKVWPFWGLSLQLIHLQLAGYLVARQEHGVHHLPAGRSVQSGSEDHSSVQRGLMYHATITVSLAMPCLET